MNYVQLSLNSGLPELWVGIPSLPLPRSFPSTSPSLSLSLSLYLFLFSLCFSLSLLCLSLSLSYISFSSSFSIFVSPLFSLSLSLSLSLPPPPPPPLSLSSLFVSPAWDDFLGGAGIGVLCSKRYDENLGASLLSIFVHCVDAMLCFSNFSPVLNVIISYFNVML